MRTFDKIVTGQGDDYTTECVLDYPYLEKYKKLIAKDLSKQELDAVAKAIQQINFTGNLGREGNSRIFFITEEAKEVALDFSKGTVEVL